MNDSGAISGKSRMRRRAAAAVLCVLVFVGVLLVAAVLSDFTILLWHDATTQRRSAYAPVNYEVRARLRMDAGDLAGAEEDWSRLIAGSTSNSTRDEYALKHQLYERSLIRYFRDNPLGAESDINWCIQLEQSHAIRDEAWLPYFYCHRARVRSALDKHELVSEDIEHSISLYEAAEVFRAAELAGAYSLRADNCLKMRDLKGAEESILQSLTLADAIPNPRLNWFGNLYLKASTIYREREELEKAMSYSSYGIELLETDESCMESLVSIACANRAIIRRGLGDHAGAVADLTRRIQWEESQGMEGEYSLTVWYGMRGLNRKEMGEFTEAEADFSRSIRWFEARSPDYDDDLAVHRSHRASVRYELRAYAGARDDVDAALAYFHEHLPDDRLKIAQLQALKSLIPYFH